MSRSRSCGLGVAGTVPYAGRISLATLVGLGRVAAEHLAVRLHQRGVVLVVEARREVGLDVVVLAFTWESAEMSGSAIGVPSFSWLQRADAGMGRPRISAV